MLTKRMVIAASVAITVGLMTASPLSHAAPAGPSCKATGSVIRLADLPEASGLVTSRTSPGRLWAHNDSGKPELFAIDRNGAVTGRVLLAGAALEDWEAMASARCGNSTCLYVGDIGDNDASRREIVVYRVPEPSTAGGSVRVDSVFRAVYPDGAHDAEALLAAPDGRLYIVTKGDTGPVALYRFPQNVRDGSTVRLERVGGPLTQGQPAADMRITDGTISPDGAWVVLRTRSRLTFYPASDFLGGTFREATNVELKALGEPQGEAVAFGAADTLYVAGEGGGKSQPGTLAVLSCAG